MLRTSIYALGVRGAVQSPMAFRSGLPRQSFLNLSSNNSRHTIAQRTFTSTRPAAKPITSFTFSANAKPSTVRIRTILQRLRTSFRSFHSSRRRPNGKPTSPDPTPNLNSPKGSGAAAEAEPQTLGARMRKLSREYGWSALGVYLALTALDFPFCYLLVRYLGTDRVGEWEHLIVSHVKQLIPESVKSSWREWRQAMKNAEREVTGQEKINEDVEMAGWGVEEATERNKKDASLATQLALAYAIHKSFIFIRVPLTATLTPRVVKVLRGWGWDIGKRTTKEAKALKRASNPVPTKKGN